MDDIRALIDSAALNVAHAEAFGSLDADARAALGAVFSTARFSLQSQRELIEWVPEIACREAVSAAEVLECPEAAALRNRAAANKPQAIERLRQALRRRRFPCLSAARNRWEQEVRAANPDPARIVFIAPEAFEHDGVEIRISARDESEAKRLCARLAELPESTWQALTRPLSSHESPA